MINFFSKKNKKSHSSYFSNKYAVKTNRYLLNNKGFTLVELLIAVSILSLTIVASVGAVSSNIKGTTFSGDQITAYYLADEALEYIHNVRANNAITNIKNFQNGTSPIYWLKGVAENSSDPCGNSKICIVDAPLETLTSCSGNISTCPYLRYDSVSGLYGYTGSWSQTQFQRTINIVPNEVNPTTEITVNVVVTWKTNGIPANYSVSEVMKAWQ